MKPLFILLLTLFGLSMFAQTPANPFEAATNPNDPITFNNPIIPGFYSDPSICRVGEDYYLITSTFEYFPGVPVFHSKDLVNWEQIGHCIDRKEQLPNGINIFAATIRYHNGVFYMITTNVVDGGNFYVTATNPAGPWSNPIWIDIEGIDPDLYFDEDGKTYVISSPFDLFEINIETGELLTEGRKIWLGTGGRYAEGPHIYKKDGFYYLMAAEGGTEEAHSETIARSNNIWGPYTENPANPILAHANAAGQNKLIQGLGHADIIQAHDNSWWVVFHGYRKSIGYPSHHILGRETCLAPVSWPKNGWPVVNGNGTVSVNMTNPTLALKPFPAKNKRTEFDETKLGLEWNFIQAPSKEKPFYELKNGKLVLNGLASKIGDNASPAFIGRRIQDLKFTAKTSIAFNPKNENEEAGLILLNNKQHFDILIKKEGKNRVLVVKCTFGSVIYETKKHILQPGNVTLIVKSEGEQFTFAYAQGNEITEVEKVDVRYLSSETVGWFTGVHIGMHASGNGKASTSPALFDYFEYNGIE
ncbi:MAG: glycoside hydrolase family 43 protein [Prolixibacteraceae bacterium]|jgi:xylan 1,4-beta-xylosidase|nr:glycoside hydrolase family 43 protein [Prolixibacteraceae bacterium]